MIQAPFSFSPETATDLSQWFTEEWMCERIVNWANIRPGSRVVEPSCGDGRLAKRMLAKMAIVSAYDIDPKWEGAIKKDWLEVRDEFDLAIMNPPYEGNADLEHAVHAAKLCRRVVMVARLVFLAGQERHRRFWSRYRLSRLAIISGRPSFDGPVDGTATTIAGANGSGKTSAMRALAATLGGDKLCPAEPVRKGADKAHRTTISKIKKGTYYVRNHPRDVT